MSAVKLVNRSVAMASMLVFLSGCHRTLTNAKPAETTACVPCNVATTTTTTSAPVPAAEGAPNVADLAAVAKPAVVNITTTQEVKVPMMPFFFDDEARLKRRGLGSGFIVDPRGYVVTNAHVVEHADEVKVRLADDRELDAKVKGRDERLDLAVLEIVGAKDLPTVALGSSDAVRVGDYVVAIGNPFGLGHTVTMGIVSAKSRAIGAGPYDDFIQTDASINPGNSGGPLFNMRGEVVGVATAINPAGRGIGFAIPSDALKDVLPQLIEKGRVARGKLGVHIQEVDEALSKALGMDRRKGALVGDVEPNGAGAKAGLEPGDVIVGLEGREVAHANELPRMVARHAPGSKVKVDVLRDKTKRTIEVTLDELKDDAKRATKTSRASEPSKTDDALGVEVVDSDEGAVVRSVRPDGPSDGVLEPGDVILEIDKKPVKTASEAARELSTRRSSPVLLRVKRGQSTRFLAIEPRS